MSNYYIIGDIHGYFDILKSTIKKVDLENDKEDMLIFLGDYIDGGKSSKQVLYFIKELSEKYQDRVIALIGNHEETFLEWIKNPREYSNYILEDKDLNTLKTFLNQEEYQNIIKRLKANENINDISIELAEMMKNNHKDLILWLKKLPYYYETDNQIFVHAGINEDAEELWKVGTSKEYFTSKFPPTIGTFYKDIIAGHIGILTFNKKTKMEGIFYDGKNHYYIDGIDGKKEKNIPVLCYDIKDKKYQVI